MASKSGTEGSKLLKKVRLFQDWYPAGIIYNLHLLSARKELFSNFQIHF